MTPYERAVKSGHIHPEDAPAGWNWKAQIPSWAFHRIALDGYQGWWMVGGAPPFVMLENAKRSASRDTATAFDDEATALFYYRDWTSSGMPWVDDGELSWSGFWFRSMSDAERFHAKYGGIASWEDDFEEKRRAMNERRR